MPHVSMVSLDFYGLVVQDLTHKPAQLYNLHYLQKEGVVEDTWTPLLFITLLKGGFLYIDIAVTFPRYDSSTSMNGHVLLQEKPNCAPSSVALEKGGTKILSSRLNRQ